MHWYLIAALALFGCKDPERTITQIKQDHAAKVEARLGDLAKIAAAIPAGDVPDQTPGAPLLLDVMEDKVNTIAVQFEDIVDARSDGTPGLRFIEKDRDVVRIGKTLVGVKTDLTGTINNWPGYERYLKKLEDAQYVLVVRSEDVRLPIKFSTSFTPGTVRSSAVLFEIATAKPLGRIAFDARSDDKMIAQNVDGHLGAEAQYQSRLEADLGAKWGKAVADAVGKKWPDAKTPYNWGLGF